MKRVLLWAVLCGAVASSVAATDCNQNGLEDAQDIASGSSEDCNSNGIPDECDLAPGRIDFVGASRVLAEGGGLAVADLDGDGLRDAVTVSFGTDPDDPGDEVFCSRNLGDAFFDEPVKFPCPEYPEVVACADLDGDGKPDLVAADELGDRVVILFNDTAPPASLDATENGVPDECEQMPFVRGDANADGTVDLSDGIYVLGYLFLGLAPPPCLRSADGDGSAVLEISDAIYVIGYLFLGGGPPPAPFPDCGSSPTADELGCGSFAPCSA